ncbi:MAG: hypothetical protein KC684_08540, partial [Candidatus Omnitrophica bacterium]|nr:hypothetical protein [Candidatus Omnitrophota bacterium]
MEELSKLLKIPEEDIKKVLANIPANYHRFIIRQKKKTREITEPSKELKRIQNAINYRLLYKKSAHPIAHAFVTGKSPKTNAAAHMGANSVYVTDIKNFFPSIRAGKVKATLDSVFPHLSEET